MQKREILINGMFALAGLIIGASLTYIYNVAIEERKISFEERKNGYAKLFEGTAKYREAQSREAEAREAKRSGNKSKAEQLEAEAKRLHADYLRLYDEARFKIGIFADSAVVQALSNYWSVHFQKEKRKCGDPKRFLDDVAIYQAIRHEMKARGNVENRT